MAFAYARLITIDHTKCGTADSADFPMLFSSTIADLKTVANGGKVTNASGFDIAFFADFAMSRRLNFEIEQYTATTGLLTAWVRIPNLSASADVSIVLAYGDSLIAVDPLSTAQHQATWDANFMAVYHLGDGSTVSLTDSTSNGNTLTNNNAATAQAGEVNGAAKLNGSTQYLSSTSNFTSLGGTALTMEAWVNGSSYSVNGGIISKGPVNSKWEFYWDASAAHTPKIDLRGGSNANTVTSTTAPTVSVWNYVAATISSTTGTHYLAGAANGSGTVTTLADGAASLFIGALDASTYKGYGGALDEVRVSNVARSTSYFTATYNSVNAPSTFYAVGAEQRISYPGSAYELILRRLGPHPQPVVPWAL